MITPGQINVLTVDRETPLGYILKDNSEEIFMHMNDSEHKQLAKGDIVKAFVFYDNKGRLAATLKTPKLVLGERKLLEVTGITKRLGVFVSLGILKDLLVPYDFLPKSFIDWPLMGDKLFVVMETRGRLSGNLVKPRSVENKIISKIGEFIYAYVAEIDENCYYLVSSDLEVFYMPKQQANKPLRLGEAVSGEVYYIGEKYASIKLTENKEDRIEDNAKELMDYLDKNSSFPLDAKSSAEDVQKLFKMSRKDFKNALGYLYKKRIVTFENGSTILVKKGKERNGK